MKVAILMASYNGEQYIREQIDSILAQTFTDWVLYINDDGSTDGTVNIIKEYNKKYPNKIHLFFNGLETHGVTSNFADLFGKVPKAEWYVLCDQDDVWITDRLQKMIDRADAEDREGNSAVPMIIYGKAQVVDRDLNILADSIESCRHTKPLTNRQHKHTLLCGTLIYGCTMMYNDALRNLVKTIPVNVGHDMYLELVCEYFGRIVPIEDVVVKYRQHGENASCGVEPFMVEVSKRLLHMHGVINRVRKMRDSEKLMLQIFFTEYYEKFSETDKLQVEKIIKILEYKSRLHSIISVVYHGYFKRGYTNIIKMPILIVKGKS